MEDMLDDWNLREAEKQVRARCKRALTKLYGINPDRMIIERLMEEDRALELTNGWSAFLLAADIADVCAKLGTPVFARGRLGASFFAYLLGITECNPLFPHLRCPNCKKLTFEGSVGSGFDLAPSGAARKTCPVCGTKLVGDGHGIPMEALFSERDDKLATLEIDVPEETLAIVRERFGAALNRLPVRVQGNRQLSVLYRANQMCGGFETQFIPGEEEIRLLISEGFSGGIGKELFPDELPLNAIPQTFSELVTLYGLVYGTGTWEANAKQLNDPEHPYRNILAFREDVAKLFARSIMNSGQTHYMANIIGTGKKLPGLEERQVPGLTDEEYDRLGKIRYLFPKAHAISALLLKLRLLRCREAHPAEYYAAVLTVETPDGTDVGCFTADREALSRMRSDCADEKPTAVYDAVLDCIGRGIEFLPADPEHSDPNAFLPCRGTIRVPLRFHTDAPTKLFFRPLAEVIKSLHLSAQGEQTAKSKPPFALSEGLHLIGGRPGIGKTTALIRLAAGLAANNTPVYVSLTEAFGLSSAMTLLPLLGEGFQTAPIWIGEGDASLETVLRAASREMSGGVLLIDGLFERIEKSGAYPMPNPYSEVWLREAAAAAALRAFVQQHHVPVVAVVPLLRDTELRADHRPTLSDVRYQRLCAEADTVVLLYRDDYYSNGGDPAMQYVIAKNDSRILDSNRHNAR